MDKTIISEISNKLIQCLNPETIYLFGSYVWGSPDENSDIDLMILIKEYSESRIKLTTKAYREIREYSQYPTDLLIRTSEEFNKYAILEGSLNNKIITKGKKLYEQRTN